MCHHRLGKHLLLFGLLLSFLLPLASHAGAEPCGVKGAIPMQVYIPFITAVGDDPIKETVKDPVTGISEEKERPCYYLKPFTKDTSGKEDAGEKAGELADYIAGLYFFAVSIGGMVAMVMIIVGGFQWMMAGGNAQGIGKAKEKITNASLGLVLLLFSYTILWTINPALVRFGSVLPAGSDKSSFADLNKIREASAKRGQRAADFAIQRAGVQGRTIDEIDAFKENAKSAVSRAQLRIDHDIMDAYNRWDSQTSADIGQQILFMDHDRDDAKNALAAVDKKISTIVEQRNNAGNESERQKLTEQLQKMEQSREEISRHEEAITGKIKLAKFIRSCYDNYSSFSKQGYPDEGCPRA